MTEKELIRFLRTGNRKPSEEMVERCINSLPEITNQNHLIPLIRLQAGSLPLTVYLLSVCVIVVQGVFTVMLPPIEALKLTGILSAASLLPYLWHLLFFYSADLAEIEKCCRYSFTQLYLARIFCLCGFTLGVYLMTALPGAYMNHMGISFLLAAVLPGCSGTFFALLWTNHSADADASLMSIYLVAAICTGMLLEQILKYGFLFLCILFLVLTAGLVSQINELKNRRMEYEAYNY